MANSNKVFTNARGAVKNHLGRVRKSVSGLDDDLRIYTRLTDIDKKNLVEKYGLENFSRYSKVMNSRLRKIRR